MHENVCAGKYRHFLPWQLACVGFHGASLPRPCLLAWRVGVPCSRRAVLPVQPRGMRATLNLILSVAPTKHTYEFAKLSVRVRYTRVPALASARSGVHTRGQRCTASPRAFSSSMAEVKATEGAAEPPVVKAQSSDDGAVSEELETVCGSRTPEPSPTVRLRPWLA